jgi:hypothetical protein
MAVDLPMVATMRHLHQITLDIHLLRLLRSKIHATAMVVERPLIKEVLPNTPQQAQPLPFSWYRRLASSGHSNRHHKLLRLRILTQYHRVECL